jgi:hypothetical protein
MTTAKLFLDKVLALRPDLAGTNEKDKATVSALAADSSKLAADVQVSTRPLRGSIKLWILKRNVYFARSCNQQALDGKLTPLTYLHSLQPTAADVALYTELHPTMVSHIFSYMRCDAVAETTW